MPTVTDWLMVIITGIYVVATIAICWANIKSAKATREQVEESKKQYEDEHRAYITAEFIYSRCTHYGIRFTNNGKRFANNIQIQFDDDFISCTEDEIYANSIKSFNNKLFTLGIGQSYDIFFGVTGFMKKPNLSPIKGTITYNDFKQTYNETFFIDIANYASVFPPEDEIENIAKSLEKQTQQLEKIQKGICKITESHMKE